MFKSRQRIAPAPDQEFPAFAEHELVVFDVDRRRCVTVILPATEEMDQLVKQRAQAALEQETAHDEERNAALLRETERKASLASTKNPSESYASTRRKSTNPFSVPDERDALQAQYDQQRQSLVGACQGCLGQVQAYAWDEPIKLLEQAAGSPDKQMRERDQALFLKLKERGAFRSVGNLCAADRALDGLRALRSQQPHFGAVIDLIQGQILLAQELDQPVRLPPILLTGAPGVGKTHFTLELARTLERPIHRHSLDSSVTGNALMGSDRHWGNTETGLVFNAVCLNDRADPIVLLDEIDKTTAHRSSNPLAPLHSLLEPVTAMSIKDISAGITFDASHVFWIATANDLLNVPAPIQSRFRIFHIQSPTAEQAIELAQTVAAAVHARFTAFDPPGRRVVTPLAHLTPREQIQALEQAYARALVNGRRHLVQRDLPATVLDGDDIGSTNDRFLH